MDPERVVTIETVDDRERAAADASAAGYRISIGDVTSAPASTDPNETALDAMATGERAAWLRAYLGSETQNGCASRLNPSRSQIERQQALVQEIFGDELEQLQLRVYADQRVVDGQAAWVECMQAQGFAFANPGAPVAEIRNAMEAQPTGNELESLQKHEREVAVADASCPFNNFGGWERVYTEVYDEMYAEFIGDHEAELLAVIEGA